MVLQESEFLLVSNELLEDVFNYLVVLLEK